MDTLTKAKAAGALRALMNMDVRYVPAPALATLLRQIVRALPPLPEGWDGEDGEGGTPEQEAQKLAGLFMTEWERGAARRDANLDDLRQRIHRIQNWAVERAAMEAVGEFERYTVWARAVRRETTCEPYAFVEIHEKGASPNGVKPLVVLPPDATRRDAEIAIRGWEAGFSRGFAQGGELLRSNMRRFFGIEDQHG